MHLQVKTGLSVSINRAYLPNLTKKLSERTKTSPAVLQIFCVYRALHQQKKKSAHKV